MNKSSRRVDPLVITLAVLLVLTAVSSVMLSGIYAKYTKGDSADSSARVARFDITESGELFSKEFAIEIDPKVKTVELDDTVMITNNSEVDVRCTFSTSSQNNLPLQYQWTCGGDSQIITNENPTATFNLDSNEGEKTYSLKVIWDTESNTSNTDFIYRRQVDSIILNITCEQID